MVATSDAGGLGASDASTLGAAVWLIADDGLAGALGVGDIG